MSNAEPEPDDRPLYKYLAVVQFYRAIESHEQDTDTMEVTAPTSVEALTEVLHRFNHRSLRHIQLYRVKGNASITEFVNEEQ